MIFFITKREMSKTVVMTGSKILGVKIIAHTSTCGKTGEISPKKTHQKPVLEEKEFALRELEKTFDSPRWAQIILCRLSKEREKRDGREAEYWARDCKKLFVASGQLELRNGDGEKVSPHYYYEEYLKSYVGNLFLVHIEKLWDLGIFEIYKPEEKPFVLYSLQRDLIKDFHPEIDAYIPLQDALDYGIMFHDITTYNPLENEGVKGFAGQKPIVYCLFHSLFTGFNFMFAVFRSVEGRWGFRFAVFNRMTIDITDSTSECRN